MSYLINNSFNVDYYCANRSVNSIQNGGRYGENFAMTNTNDEKLHFSWQFVAYSCYFKVVSFSKMYVNPSHSKPQNDKFRLHFVCIHSYIFKTFHLFFA